LSLFVIYLMDICELGDLITSGPSNGLYKSEKFIGSGTLFLDIKSLYRGFAVDLNEPRRVELNEAEKNKYELLPGDILINRVSKKPDGVGKAVIVTDLKETAVYESNIMRFRVDTKRVVPWYIIYHLASETSRNELLSKANISNQASINQETVKSLKINLPPLPEQKRIAAILEKCDRLRRTRRYSLQLTETFLQSVFLEMFGDPATNPMGWDIKTIEDVANKSNGAIKCGPFGSQLLISELQNDGIPVYGIDNVQKNQFLWAKPKFISHEKFKELKSFSINSGDVLISRTGTVGRACLAPDSIPKSIIGPNLLKVTLDQSKLLPIVLSCAINYCSSVLEEIILMSPGATVAVFNTGNLKSLKLPIPPLPLQEKFAQIVQKHDRFRTQQREAQRQAEHLFQTLLHRAFRGELTSSDCNEVDISALSAENHPQQPKPKSTDKAENFPIPATQTQTNALQLTLPGLE
jgi:type I restriction enzyme, S subunit